MMPALTTLFPAPRVYNTSGKTEKLFFLKSLKPPAATIVELNLCPLNDESSGLLKSKSEQLQYAVRIPSRLVCCHDSPVLSVTNADLNVPRSSPLDAYASKPRSG